MITSDLQELGLTKNEASIYVALLELGPSTTGPIIKKTNIYRVMVYDTLEQLLKKGLVNYSLKRNRKVFEAEDPIQLNELLRTKQNTTLKAIKDLKQIRQHHPVHQGAQTYEGWSGIKAAQENHLKAMKENPKGEYIMVGASTQLHKKLDDFYNYFHEQRSKMKIPAKLLFNENNKRAGNLKKRYKPVEVKFMPEKMVTPSWVSIYNDCVLIGNALDVPMALFIKNKAIAESYRLYFYQMWNQPMRIYTGKEAAKIGDNDIIKEGKEVLVFGMGRRMTAKVYPDLTKKFAENRVKSKIKARYLLNNQPSQEEINLAYDYPLTERKIMPTEYFSPVTTIVYGNKVSIWIWAEKNLTVMIAHDKELATYHRGYFESMWRTAK